MSFAIKSKCFCKGGKPPLERITASRAITIKTDRYISLSTSGAGRMRKTYDPPAKHTSQNEDQPPQKGRHCSRGNIPGMGVPLAQRPARQRPVLHTSAIYLTFSQRSPFRFRQPNALAIDGAIFPVTVTNYSTLTGQAVAGHITPYPGTIARLCYILTALIADYLFQ